MKPPATHPREEEAAAYVFDHMDGAEREAFEKALGADALLRQTVDELVETAAAMSLALPQSAPPPALKERMLENVKPMAQEKPLKRVKPAPGARRGVLAFGLLGWAAAAVVAVLGAQLWQRQEKTEHALVEAQSNAESEKRRAAKAEGLLAEAQTRAASLQTALDQGAKANKELQDANTKITAAAAVLKQELASTVETNKALEAEKAIIIKSRELDRMQIATLKSTIAEYKQGVAVVVWDGAKQEGLLKLEKMPAVDTNKAYQLWVVDPSKKTPVNAGVVRVDSKGFAKVQFKPVDAIEQADKFALSVEKKVDDPAGVPANAGPVVLLSQ